MSLRGRRAGLVVPTGGSRCIPLWVISRRYASGRERGGTMPIKDVEAVDHHLVYIESEG